MQNAAPETSFIAGEALEIYRRVKLTGTNTVSYADAGEDAIGVTQTPAASGAAVNVRDLRGPGTFKIAAAGAISANASVFAAADGKIASSGSLSLGISQDSASADGDPIEIVPTPANASPGADGLSVRKTARVTWDASAGKAIGAHALSVTLPDDAVIIGGFVEVNTTFTSATDAATIAIHVEGANDIVSAIAISNGANPWDAGRKAIVPKNNTPESTSVKLSAARAVTATVAVEAITAGKFTVFLDYVVGA